MATTNYAFGHPLAPVMWRRKLAVESLRKSYFSDLIGTSSDSVIQQLDDLSKGGGDRVTFGLRGQLTGGGVLGDGTLENNEEKLSTYTDTLVINQLRHAVRSAGKMSEQRVLFNLRDEAKSGLSDWFAARYDAAMFNQLCGFTAQQDIRFTGQNPTIAPDAAHIYRPNAKVADEALTTGDEFTLGMIDVMVARAAEFTNENGSGNPIRPATFNGTKRWIIFLHPNQAYQLRSTAAAGSWIDYQKAQVQGGVTDTALFKGGYLMGEYNGVLLVIAPRITRGVNSTTGAAVTNVRRAVLVGAQAGVFAMGRDSAAQGDRYTWVEESFDYGNQLGVSAGAIFGMKKTRFTPADNMGPTSDFATFVASTFSPAP